MLPLVHRLFTTVHDFHAGRCTSPPPPFAAPSLNHQFEACGQFWDLATGARLCKTPKLGDSMRPGKFTLMSVAFSPTGSVLAYSNSNDCDDPTLKLIRPRGK